MFNTHFGPQPDILTDKSIEAANERKWQTTRNALKGFGRVVEMQPEGSSQADSVKNRASPHRSLLTSSNGRSPRPYLTVCRRRRLHHWSILH